MTVSDAQVGSAMNALVTYYEAQGHVVRPESIDYQALRVALEAVLDDEPKCAHGSTLTDLCEHAERTANETPPLSARPLTDVEAQQAYAEEVRARTELPGCPDGGTCHHACGTGACFRVLNAGPLSGVFPTDQWPMNVYSEHAARESKGHL